MTPSPTIPAPTDTPYPPIAAVASSVDYPGKIIATLSIDGINYRLYHGISADNGSLLLPGSKDYRAAALYQNTIWSHRLWSDGWLKISNGSEVTITYPNGKIYTYIANGKTYQPYGQYFPSDSLQFASCYSGDTGKWEGIELYQLHLVKIYTFLPRHAR
jgi:hypothetical protein